MTLLMEKTNQSTTDKNSAYRTIDMEIDTIQKLRASLDDSLTQQKNF